jgi:hypothetical protein
MALFEKRTEIFTDRELSVGEFDPTKPGCYDNVKTFPLTVKPKRALYIKVNSSIPISVAIADSDNSCIFHKEDVKEGTFGPISTSDNKEMGLLIGVFPGDKAKSDVEIWMEKL